VIWSGYFSDAVKLAQESALNEITGAPRSVVSVVSAP
jgi:hypothetical protein